MEVHHKPKAWRGWREFLKEVGTIVLGVLIALALEQAAEWARWRHKTTELREAMASELAADDGPQAYSRLAIRGCLYERLDELQRAAEQGRSRLELARLARAYPVSDQTWDAEGWKAFLAADGPAHMSSDEADRWWADYSVIPKMDQIAEDERQALGALRAIRPKDGPMSEPELQELDRAVERLRNDNDWIVAYARVLLAQLTYRPDGEHVGLDKAETQRVKAELVKRHNFGSCIEAVQLTPAGLRNVLR